MKGARREIKKDNQFLARQKLHEQMERYCVLLHTFVWRSHSRVAKVREYHLENDLFQVRESRRNYVFGQGNLEDT